MTSIRGSLIGLMLLSLGSAATADVALLRDEVYSAVKQLGVEPEILAPALASISAEAAAGRVDGASIHDVTSSLPDHDVAMKVERLLVHYAEQAAKRMRVGLRHLPVELGSVEAPKPIEPSNNGTCVPCPSFDFGPFTPTMAWQYHSESTDATGDCNIYSFNVLAGESYAFSLCTSDGALATWDTRLTGMAAVGCAMLFANDDACSLQSRASWTAPFTGTLVLKLDGFRGSPSGDFGDYTLGYRVTSCSTCALPLGPLTMTTSCQIASGTLSSACPAIFWSVNLVAGATYVFTTCPSRCAALACPTIPDTLLELYSPGLGCEIGQRVASSDDDSFCQDRLKSTITYIPTTTGPHVIKARGFSSAVGPLCMGYWQQLGPTCPNTCASGPFLATLTPTAQCQSHSSAIVPPCADAWYVVDALAAGLHEFSTCPVTCAGGMGSFDSIIELYSASCVLLASDNDGCGAPRSRLTVNIPTPGRYRLRIRTLNGGNAPYTLTYVALTPACTAPSGVMIRPASGTASPAPGTCVVSQVFTLTSSGTPAMAYAWSITPPFGASASPASGMAGGGPSATNSATFTSALAGEGVFSVIATATNACGNALGVRAYSLRDASAPVFTSFPSNTTVRCDRVPPPPALSASDNCDPNPVETFSEAINPGACPGRYSITRTWTARDRSGNVSAPRSQVLIVTDRIAPVIVPDTSVKYCLHPPNHALACFVPADFTPVITDDCSSPITWRFIGVLNSEAGFPGACPPGDIDPDVVVAPDGSSACVRAERCGSDPALDDGRVYLVLATATDACGNTSTPTPIGAILVPHDSADTSDCITP